jgi:hypothetical protein
MLMSWSALAAPIMASTRSKRYFEHTTIDFNEVTKPARPR